MWYVAWLLGLPLAAAFAGLNAMWYELMEATPARPAAPDRPDRQPLSAEG